MSEIGNTRADKVCKLARVYAHRQEHHINHTGHTVRRLLEAVSALLGRRVTIVPNERARPEAKVET